MTTDHDHANPDIALLAWRRDMTQFRQVNLQVQGADQGSCMDALNTEMRKFTDEPASWTLVSARYTRETVASTQDGGTAFTVWALDAVLIKTEGLVPWSGLE